MHNSDLIQHSISDFSQLIKISKYFLQVVGALNISIAFKMIKINSYNSTSGNKCQ